MNIDLYESEKFGFVENILDNVKSDISKSIQLFLKNNKNVNKVEVSYSTPSTIWLDLTFKDLNTFETTIDDISSEEEYNFNTEEVEKYFKDISEIIFNLYEDFGMFLFSIAEKKLNNNNIYINS